MNNLSNNAKFKFFSSNWSYHSFFITKKKKIFSTGSNSDSQRLIVSKKETCMPLMISMKTVDPTKVIKISCGTSSTIVLTKENEGKSVVQVVGFNRYGQLSLGDEINRDILTIVDFFNEKKVLSVFSGLCVSFFISKDNKKVFSCGDNEYGQLGLGDRKNRNIAQKITGISNVIDISCGGRFVMFLKQNGKVFFTGNIMKRLFSTLSPKLIECKEKIIEISSGTFHILALGKSKRVYAAGQDTVKQLLGTGHSNSLVELSYFNDLNPKSIMCCLHSSFVLSEDGTVRAWGCAEYYQFGNGENKDIGTDTPFVVKNNIFQMFNTRCGIFLFEKNGDVYITGDNECNELGKKGIVKVFEKSKNIVNVSFEKGITFGEILPIKTYSSISEISLCFDKIEIKFPNSSYSVLIDCCYAIRSPVLKKKIIEKKKSILITDKQYFNAVEFIESWLKTDVIDVKMLNVDLIKGIYVMAKRWKLFKLSKKVIESVNELDLESVITLIFLLCEEEGDSALFLKCIRFLKDNYDSVSKHTMKLIEYIEKGGVYKDLSARIIQLNNEAELRDLKSHFEFTLNDSKVDDLKIHLIGLLVEENSKDLCFKSLDGKFIKVHKEIITKKCEYFKSMLTTQFKEASQKIVDINVHSEVLIPIITYFYTSSIDLENKTLSDLILISLFAEKFLMDNLKEYLDESISNCDFDKEEVVDSLKSSLKFKMKNVDMQFDVNQWRKKYDKIEIENKNLKKKLKDIEMKDNEERNEENSRKRSFSEAFEDDEEEEEGETPTPSAKKKRKKD